MPAKTEREVWLNLAAVFCGATSADEAGALMKRTVGELVKLDGVGILKDKDRAILEREGTNAQEWSNRPVILTDESSTYSVLVDHHWDESSNYHYVTAGAGSSMPAGEVSAEWARLVQRAEPLVSALSPDFAFGFGVYEGTDTDPVNYGTLCSKGIRELTAWTFVKSERLGDELAGLLRSVGEAGRTIGSGALFTLASRPGEKPEDRVMKPVAAAKVTYVDPLLER